MAGLRQTDAHYEIINNINFNFHHSTSTEAIFQFNLEYLLFVLASTVWFLDGRVAYLLLQSQAELSAAQQPGCVKSSEDKLEGKRVKAFLT